jgi:hypothetical protein
MGTIGVDATAYRSGASMTRLWRNGHGATRGDMVNTRCPKQKNPERPPGISRFSTLFCVAAIAEMTTWNDNRGVSVFV